MGARHTTCRFCQQDIEGISPYRAGEWRDRGNNATCPTKAGDRDGLKHAPYRPGKDDDLKICTECCGPVDKRTRRVGGEVCWTCATAPDGTEGQDRESYTDDQDRENYNND